MTENSTVKIVKVFIHILVLFTEELQRGKFRCGMDTGLRYYMEFCSLVRIIKIKF